MTDKRRTPSGMPGSFVNPSVLSSIAGIVDSVGFLALFGIFVTFQSGNSILLGVSLGQGDWSTALKFLIPVASFVIGVALAALVATRLGLDDKQGVRTAPLLLESAALAVFVLLTQTVFDTDSVRPDTLGFFVLALIAGIAVGMQTIALEHVEGVAVRTTFVSGVLTTLATKLVAAATERDGDKKSVARRHARIVASLWASYVLGGCIGAFLYFRLNTWTLLLPIICLLMLVASIARRKHI